MSFSVFISGAALPRLARRAIFSSAYVKNGWQCGAFALSDSGGRL